MWAYLVYNSTAKGTLSLKVKRVITKVGVLNYSTYTQTHTVFPKTPKLHKNTNYTDNILQHLSPVTCQCKQTVHDQYSLMK